MSIRKRLSKIQIAIMVSLHKRGAQSQEDKVGALTREIIGECL